MPYQLYYPPSAINSPLHIMQELGQRKRPKYTRSTTGCLTCRIKKIKVRASLQSDTPAHLRPVR